MNTLPMDHASTRSAERRKGRKAARQRMAPSGAEVQPWYGLTEIDDELATAVHYQRRDIGGALKYDLRFAARDVTVAYLMDLDTAEVRDAVGDVNAWAIATAELATGVLSNSALAGAYGLSPMEALRRAAERGSDTGRSTLLERDRHVGLQLDQVHQQATVRRAVEEAAHPLLAEGIPNPVARRRFVSDICQRLQFQMTSWQQPETTARQADGQAGRTRQGRGGRPDTHAQADLMP